MMPFDEKQIAALDADLDPKHVATRSQAGQTLAYIESWRAIAEANRIFGHDGWTRETIDIREVRPAELVGDKWRVGFMARVRVHAGGIFRDGCGYGSGISRDMGDAYESAIKEAESDGGKRALSTFGWPFGLALYDKSREHVGPNGATRPQEREKPAKPPVDNCKTAIEKIAVAEDSYSVGLILGKAIDWHKDGKFNDDELEQIKAAAARRREQFPPAEETDEMRNLRAG